MSAPTPTSSGKAVVLSFDVEEHHRIEAAAGLTCPPGLCAEYGRRMESCTRWILEELAALDLRATFFVVGTIAKTHPGLVRDLHALGHEVASHGWAHRRIHRLTPHEFREDLRRARDALEDVTGAAVVGYRAPTFSVTRETAWAIDLLAEAGLRYDSSIYPVRHDRYGVPDAPRVPFLARGPERAILELPPATLAFCGANLPVGGGGYFRLLPLWLMELALAQVNRAFSPAVTMLYFHPWEFDPDQPRLPLGALSRFRTYVGTRTSRERLRTLLRRHRHVRAIDVVSQLDAQDHPLTAFDLTRCREDAKVAYSPAA
jgi:polysaccharide deacetylase family protein (PEP-CTERM system associated)